MPGHLLPRPCNKHLNRSPIPVGLVATPGIIAQGLALLGYNTVTIQEQAIARSAGNHSAGGDGEQISSDTSSTYVAVTSSMPSL